MKKILQIGINDLNFNINEFDLFIFIDYFEQPLLLAQMHEINHANVLTLKGASSYFNRSFANNSIDSLILNNIFIPQNLHFELTQWMPKLTKTSTVKIKDQPFMEYEIKHYENKFTVCKQGNFWELKWKQLDGL